MPRNARCIVPGTAYHVTQRGTNRQAVFFSKSDRLAYLRLLQENLGPADVRLLAWCLMSNHVHLILSPGQEDSLEVLLRRVHGRYAQMLNVRRLRTGHLWQNRFFSCPLSETHLRRVLAYVELNPVRAGIVAQPAEYEWSSAGVHLGLTSDRLKLVDQAFWRELGAVDGWRALLTAVPSTPDHTPPPAVYLCRPTLWRGGICRLDGAALPPQMAALGLRTNRKRSNGLRKGRLTRAKA